jgi:hypothetical protein
LTCSWRQRKGWFLGGWRGAAKAQSGHWPQSQHAAMKRSVECAQAHIHLFGPKTSILSKICKNRAQPEKGKKRGHSCMPARLETPDATSRLKKNKIY